MEADQTADVVSDETQMTGVELMRWRFQLQALTVRIQRAYRKRMKTHAEHAKQHPSLPASYVAGKSVYERSWVFYIAANMLCYNVWDKKCKTDDDKKKQMRAYCMMRHLFSLLGCK